MRKTFFLVLAFAVACAMASAQSTPSIPNGDVESGAWLVLAYPRGGGDMNLPSLETGTVYAGSNAMKLTAQPLWSATDAVCGAKSPVTGLLPASSTAVDIELYCYVPRNIPPEMEEMWLKIWVDNDDGGDLTGGPEADYRNSEVGSSTDLKTLPRDTWVRLVRVGASLWDQSRDSEVLVGPYFALRDSDSNPPVNQNYYCYVDGLAVVPAPVADFTASPASGDAPLEVTFTYTGTGGLPNTYAWDFDNNASTDSTEPNPTTTYTVGGLHTVKLTVENTLGTDTITKAGVVNVIVPASASEWEEYK